MDTTNVIIERGPRPGDAATGFEPAARNAFRALGLAASAAQREVFDAASSLRLALKVGVEKSFAADLEWLAPLARTESDLRDALGRLSAPAERARERLFWFHSPVTLAPPETAADLLAAAEALLAAPRADDEGGAPRARHHDAALLLLAGLYRLDPSFREAAAWRRAFGLWGEVCGDAGFWSRLVAADLKGGFEPAVTFGEAAALRSDAPRLASAPVAEYAKTAAADRRAGDAGRALRVLRAVGLPAPLAAEYEDEIVGPFEDRADESVLEAFSLVEFFYEPSDSAAAKRTFFARALGHVEAGVKPALRELLEAGGAESRAVRRVFAEGSRRILRLSEGYAGLDDEAATAAELLELARALAPLGSPESAEEAGALRGREQPEAGAGADAGAAGADAGAASVDDGAGNFEAAALEALRREMPGWRLKEDAFPIYRRSGLDRATLVQLAIYVAVGLAVFMVIWLSGGLKSGRGRYSPGVGVLMNYNVPAMRPALPPPVEFKPSPLTARVSAAELRELLAAGRVTVVDVRGRAEYEAGHLPGAVWMPAEEVEKRHRSLLRPKRRIVFYCDCAYDMDADSAAFRVKLFGRADVAVLEGGYAAWLAGGGESAAGGAGAAPAPKETKETDSGPAPKEAEAEPPTDANVAPPAGAGGARPER